MHNKYTESQALRSCASQAGFQLRQPRAPEEPRLLPGSPKRRYNGEKGIKTGELPSDLYMVMGQNRGTQMLTSK